MITLREMRDSDLPALWEHLSDPEAQHMAAITGPYHYDRALFDAHFTRIRADPAVLSRTVLSDDEVVGQAAVYGPPDEREVTYWIARPYWGRGIATTALTALLDLDPTRPLHAHAAADNTASVRVLRKCGFVLTGRDTIFAESRAREIEEVSLILA